jgi:uncharacterized protein (DUF305 family)
MRHDTHGTSPADAQMMGHHYRMLAVNLGLSLAIMYVAMFAMIWSGNEFIQNANFLYMALVMWAPMAIVMLLTMKSMYKNRRLNAILYIGFAAIALLSLLAIRDQSLVGDRQFLRSMIPHHSGAILMCERAAISDPQVQELCFGPQGIVASQKREIELMENILWRP